MSYMLLYSITLCKEYLMGLTYPSPCNVQTYYTLQSRSRVLSDFCLHSETLPFSITCQTSNLQLIENPILMTNSYLKFPHFPTTLLVLYIAVVIYYHSFKICSHGPFEQNQGHFLSESLHLCSQSLKFLSSLKHHESTCHHYLNDCTTD